MSWLLPVRQSWSSHLTPPLLVHSLQAAVGGRMRLFISGGAPLPPYAGAFIATAMNVPVLQVSRCYCHCLCFQWHSPYFAGFAGCSHRRGASPVCPRIHPRLKLPVVLKKHNNRVTCYVHQFFTPAVTVMPLDQAMQCCVRCVLLLLSGLWAV